QDFAADNVDDRSHGRSSVLKGGKSGASINESAQSRKTREPIEFPYAIRMAKFTCPKRGTKPEIRLVQRS
ncbi:MAG: hypothetical protein KDJ74_10815, partial [Notoacmeibacter sp.]|nr:hypothetical protein [Notoacmeibacter sp.]